MAQQVNVKFVDDLDGSDAAGTVSFAIDGRAYEIDLSEDNAARLRDSLASFVAAARKSGESAAAAGRRAQKMTASSGRRPEPLDRERPRRSGPGPGRTATRSPTAAGSPRPWWTPSRPPTDPSDTTGEGPERPEPGGFHAAQGQYPPRVGCRDHRGGRPPPHRAVPLRSPRTSPDFRSGVRRSAGCRPATDSTAGPRGRPRRWRRATRRGSVVRRRCGQPALRRTPERKSGDVRGDRSGTARWGGGRPPRWSRHPTRGGYWPWAA